MSLYQLKIEIPQRSAEAADTALLEFEGSNWSVFEDIIEKRAWLVGVGDDEASLRSEWSRLVPVLAQAGVKPLGETEGGELADADWRDSYKAHFHAWKFGRLHWVPVWERPTFELPPGDAVLWLDPGLAFGTGNHETTRLCIERLVAIDADLPARGWRREAVRIIDAGCGSGILALSAALLGYKDVAGFDNDPEAVRVSEENATLNGLSGRVQFFTGDLVSGLAGSQAEIVLANIQADVLMRFAAELTGSVAPGGTLILSGILAIENARVKAAFEAAVPGWPAEARVMGEWSDVMLRRPV